MGIYFPPLQCPAVGCPEFVVQPLITNRTTAGVPDHARAEASRLRDHLIERHNGLFGLIEQSAKVSAA